MDMAESHGVSALANERAEIAGMIARAQQQLGQFRAGLVHLDATIRLFAPAMEPETIPPKRIVHLISGSNQEVCRAVCSMRFVGRVRRSAHRTSSGP
jgi:hypothetical protein